MQNQPHLSFIILSFTCAVLAYTTRANISIAIVEMAHEFHWSSSQQGSIMSSFFYGYISTQVPGGILASIVGGKGLITWAVLGWSVCTIVTPMVAPSRTLVSLARFGVGFCQGVFFPSIQALVIELFSVQQRAAVVSFIHAGGHLGSALANGLCPGLIEEFHWTYAFWTFGVAGMVWVPFWLSLVPPSAVQPDVPLHPGGTTKVSLRSSATRHTLLPTSSDQVASPRSTVARMLSQPTVVTDSLWSAVATRSFLVTAFTHFCNQFSFYVAFFWLPSFFIDELHLTMREIRVAGFAPWLLMVGFTVASGVAADRMVRVLGMPSDAVRRRLTLIGMLTASIFLVLASNETAETSYRGAALLAVGLGSSAISLSGWLPAFAEISERHAAVLYALSSTCTSLAGIVGVPAAGALRDMTGSFHSVFMLSAAVYAAGGIVFFLGYGGSRSVGGIGILENKRKAGV